MNSADWTNKDNERSFVIDELIEFCTKHGLNYSYTEKLFSIPLPVTDPLPTAVELSNRPNKRKKLDIDKLFPSNGIVEGEEPDPEQPLDEGMPPKEQL